MNKFTTDGKKIVQAPPPIGAFTSSAVLSVALVPDEEVEWYWSYYPDGSSAATGYSIIKKPINQILDV